MMTQDTPNQTARKKLDDLINDRLARPTLVSAMGAAADKKRAANSTNLLKWSDEWRKYPWLYIFLAVSALFTLTLGMFMGLAPKVDPLSNTVFFHTDILHIFLAFVYMVAFGTVTEGAFAVGKWLFHTRENDNAVQTWTMVAMMVIAGISILATGIAGGMVVASNIAYLSAFIEIPPAAQKWVIVAIPVLITVYAFLLTAYGLSSARAKTERMLEQARREQDLDHETRRRAITQIAEEQIQVAELGRFLEMVEAGKMTSAEARAAVRAGHTLGQAELHLGRDLNEDGKVGSAVSARPLAPEVMERKALQPQQPSNNGSHPR